MYPGVERRKHPRYKVKSDILAVLTPYPVKLGQIANISEGGAAFVYQAGEPMTGRYTHLDLYVTRGRKIFNRLPVNTLGHVSVDNLYDASVCLRQVSLSFGGLNTGQKKQINHFIEHFTL